MQVAERTPFEAKWRLLARVGVRCYILISSVSGAVKVAPLQILQFPVILPHKFQDAEKFNLQFSDFSEITETADKLRWLRYQKGLRQRDVADYAGIDRSTYVHYEEYGKDLYPPEHMEKIAQLFEVPVETLLDMNLVGPNAARNITNLILDTLSRLEMFPLSGHIPQDKELRNGGYRYVIAGKYICVYRLIAETVYVYHIAHSASNYPTLFKRLLKEENQS